MNEVIDHLPYLYHGPIVSLALFTLISNICKQLKIHNDKKQFGTISMHMISNSFTMKGVTFLCKVVSLSVLVLFFIFFFGLPSSDKFQTKGLTVEHSTEMSEEGNLLPGITVCPYHANPRTPWRNHRATMDRLESVTYHLE